MTGPQVEPETALAHVSVRGEARLTVGPDCGLFYGSLRTTRETKAGAMQAVAGQIERLMADLRAMGGVPSGVDTEHHALTWSAHSATTEEDWDHESGGRSRRTGRVSATVAITLAVRNFALLERLGATVAVHESFHVHGVSWLADADNPGWAEVRAAAIHGAIAKGRDYAAALGGEIVRVDHIADAGLLAGAQESDGHAFRNAKFGVSMEAMDTSGSATPSLDPVPQELVAAIDARLVATIAPLAEL